MSMPKIKSGNSFYVDYTLMYSDEGVDVPLNIDELLDLKVCIEASIYNKRLYPDYTTHDNVISIHIKPEDQPYYELYRVILTAKYNDNDISRNPKAYQIVPNTEDETGGSCGCVSIGRLIVSDCISIINGSGFTESDMWNALAGEGEQQIHSSHISEATKDFITASDLPNVPTKTSELTNDSGFITSSSIPTKTSQLTNDSQFVTSSDVIAARKLLFIDMWNKAAGSFGAYNASTGFFELNGLTDITYEEALLIYEARTFSMGGSTYMFFFGRQTTIRTNLPYDYDSGSDPLKFGINWNQTIQVLNIAPITTYMYAGSYWSNTRFTPFYNCTALKAVQGIINVSNVSASNAMYYYNVPELETINIAGMKNGLGFFRGCPKITLESMRYLVTNATNTASVIVWVHADTYAKLTNTSNTGWYQLMQDAIAKQIQFATS